MSDPLAPLRDRFLERTRGDLEVLREPFQNPEVTASLVHRLSGAAGVFGFAEVSRLAAVVDDEIHGGQPPSQASLDALLAAVEALPFRPA